MSEDGQDRHLPRRAALKAFVGVGLSSRLAACAATPAPTQTPSPATAPEPKPETRPAAGEPSEAAAASSVDPGVEAHEHPGTGDLLTHAIGDLKGEAIRPEDLALGDPQIVAYPMDAIGGHVGDDSRLNQILVVRMDPAELTEETLANAADGIVAYSAVCTHTGCEVTDWDEDARHLVCPCHDSVFDPADNGRVIEGPARRRLAALPLRIEGGELRIAGSFTGRIGRQRRR